MELSGTMRLWDIRTRWGLRLITLVTTWH